MREFWVKTGAPTIFHAKLNLLTWFLQTSSPPPPTCLFASRPSTPPSIFHLTFYIPALTAGRILAIQRVAAEIEQVDLRSASHSSTLIPRLPASR
jgi:hypothetical protein